MRRWPLQIFWILIAALNGCASGSTGDDPPLTKAHPASYSADGFMQNHFPPYHPKEKTNSMPFYFKQCSPTGDNSYFSKTSYYCGYRDMDF